MVKKRETLFAASWRAIKKNKILFVPNIIILFFNLGLFYLLLYFSGAGEAIVQNDYLALRSALFSLLSLFYLAIYFVLIMLVDNYFLAMKYGLIKTVLLRKKANLMNGIKFANEYYFSTLGIHVLSYLIIFIPLILLGALLFLLLPFSPLLAIAVFIPLLIIYLVFISIRLIFVYPVMTFEKEGAYNSLKQDFHFVKTHVHHSLITWLIVIGFAIFISLINNGLEKFGQILTQQTYFWGVLLVIIILGLEMIVSVWEHVFIFKSYLTGRKIKKRRKNKKN
jgi:hypothetical protein